MKPTSAQARLLERLKDRSSWIYISGDPVTIKRALFEGPGQIVDLRSTTVRVLIKHKWIEVTDEISHYSSREAHYYKISAEGINVLNELDAEDFSPPTPNITAEDLKNAIRNSLDVERYPYLFEQPTGTGTVDRYFDGIAIGAFPFEHHKITIYEIKITRQDLKHELENPAKRLPAMQLADYFYFVTPVGLVGDPKNDLPENIGLIEVDKADHLRYRIKAPPLDPSGDIDRRLFASVMRRAARAENELNKLQRE